MCNASIERHRPDYVSPHETPRSFLRQMEANDLAVRDRLFKRNDSMIFPVALVLVVSSPTMTAVARRDVLDVEADSLD
jgi:hypothetical protein